jgi:hypothetical protein
MKSLTANIMPAGKAPLSSRPHSVVCNAYTTTHWKFQKQAAMQFGSKLKTGLPLPNPVWIISVQAVRPSIDQWIRNFPSSGYPEFGLLCSIFKKSKDGAKTTNTLKILYLFDFLDINGIIASAASHTGCRISQIFITFISQFHSRPLKITAPKASWVGGGNSPIIPADPIVKRGYTQPCR